MPLARSSLDMALGSILLYTAFIVLCLFCLYKFWDFENGRLHNGRYNKPKFIFFVVLTISAVLDLPMFITCAAKGGPPNCAWSDESYTFAWCCHQLSTCGYEFAIITPSILWSDIIHSKDGHFWNSASPLDSLKIFFRVSYVLYCFIILLDVIGAIIYGANVQEEYSRENMVGVVTLILIPIMLVVVTLGCLWSGISLCQYIVNVHLNNSTTRNILVQLNVTMAFIVISYCVRAILIMTRFDDLPSEYRNSFKSANYYPAWLFLTQWLPYIFCSFFLALNMRFRGVDASHSSSDSKHDSWRLSSMAHIMNSKFNTNTSKSNNNDNNGDVNDPRWTTSTATASISTNHNYGGGRGGGGDNRETLNPFGHPSTVSAGDDVHSRSSSQASMEASGRTLSYLLSFVGGTQQATGTTTAPNSTTSSSRSNQHQAPPSRGAEENGGEYGTSTTTTTSPLARQATYTPADRTFSGEDTYGRTISIEPFGNLRDIGDSSNHQSDAFFDPSALHARTHL